MKLKRIFYILPLSIALLGCVGDKTGEEKKADAEEVAEKIENDVFSGERKSKEAAEFYFKKLAGLDMNNILPDYPYDFEPEDKWFIGEERNVLAGFYKKEGAELSKDEYKTYVRKVFEATKKISDDGFNIYGFEKRDKKEEALGELSIDELFANDDKGIIYLGMYGWGYRYKGVMLCVNLQLDETRGENKKYYASVQIYPGLTKSLDESLKDAEEVLKREDVQEAIKDYVNK